MKKTKGVSCIERKGETYWYAQIDGRKLYCGKGDKGRKIAVAARAKHEATAYEHKEVRAGLKVKKAEFHTFRELCDWYMLLPGTQYKKNYANRINDSRHLLDCFGRMHVSDIDGTEQEKYRSRRQAEGAANGTVDNEIALLSAMYHLAVRDRKILADQTPGRFVLAREINPRRIITDEEAEELFSAAKDHDCRDVFICGLESAMRLSEICKLTAGQVRLDQVMIMSGRRIRTDTIDLGIFDTKNRTPRVVPVSPRLKAILRKRTGRTKTGGSRVHKGRKPVQQSDGGMVP
jgi:integrase